MAMDYEAEIAALTKENPFISKTDIAYTLVLQDILEGRLHGGARINQEELSTRFGLSRSPIREALNRLVEERFLDKSGTSGYNVYDMRLGDYISLNEFRSMLEIFASRLAVKHITDSEMEALRANLRATEAAAAHKNVKAFLPLDEEFHLILVRAANNPHLLETYLHYCKRFQLFRIRTVSDEVLTAALKWHRKIYQAVLDGDVELAVENTRMHRETTINSALTICRDRH